MNEDAPRPIPDLTLKSIGKQDLYDMSVADLEERIEALKTEISRCESAIESRGATRSAADKLFKF